MSLPLNGNGNGNGLNGNAGVSPQTSGGSASSLAAALHTVQFKYLSESCVLQLLRYLYLDCVDFTILDNSENAEEA